MDSTAEPLPAEPLPAEPLPAEPRPAAVRRAAPDRVSRRTPLGTRLLVGHALATVLAVGDVVSPFLVFPTSGEFSPGTSGTLLLVTFGLLTLVGSAAHLGTRRRGWLRVVAAVRTLSALTAVPAFVVPGVPPLYVVLAAVCVALTIVDVVLLLAPKPTRGR